MSHLRVNRHVKIVCTLGPASNSPEVIERMLRGGTDIVRLNLAYGTLEEHSRLVSEVRSISNKLNLPTGILLDLPGLKYSAGDIESVFGQHLRFAHSQGVDFIALSFISTPQQVKEVKGMLKQMDADIPIIVKIEQAEALKESASIIETGEGVMVARGDLALEISIEKVPLAQKMLVKQANRCGKPVIIATQMLESMVHSASPTRAEATDVANAILDGSDALMLSEETAIGSHPVAATEVMSRIAIETETALPYEQMLRENWNYLLPEVNDATARAACQMAHQVQAKAIIAFTTGGTTALRVSKYRPREPILAVTPSDKIFKRLSLLWGVLPIRKPAPANLEEVFAMAGEVAWEVGVATTGDLIVVTAGIPMTHPGSTNLVKIQSV